MFSTRTTHLKQYARDDDTELEQQVVARRIELGEIDKGQIVVEAVEERGHAVQEENLAILGHCLDQFPKRVSEREMGQSVTCGQSMGLSKTLTAWNK